MRKFNWTNQQRVDIPHLRLLESAVVADFDVLAGYMLAVGQPYIVSGFTIVASSINADAPSIQLNTAGGLIMNVLATEAGSIFQVPSNRAVETLNSSNSRVVGSFTANSTNYVSIDIRRSADATTADQLQILDTVDYSENPESLPLGLTLDYVINISTTDFSSTPGFAPVAKVVTDANNNVSSVIDARQLIFRLGSGGSNPNTTRAYEWPQGRSENTSSDAYYGGDKGFRGMKDWMDAIMTRIWEIGGGRYWYSPTADRNVRLARSGATFANGEYFSYSAPNLLWKGLRLYFDNSGSGTFYNIIQDQTVNSTGLTDLNNDGDCIYVDIDRTSNATITAQKGNLATLGYPLVPGTRHVIAARLNSVIVTKDSSFPVGSTFTVAGVGSLGIVALNNAASNPALPLVPAVDASGQITNTNAGGPGSVWTGTTYGAKGISTGAGGVGLSGAGSGTAGVGMLAMANGGSPTIPSTTGGQGLLAFATTGIGGIIQKTDPTGGSYTNPMLVSQTSDGNRFVLDHNGFPIGARIVEIKENWTNFFSVTSGAGTTPLTNNTAWTANIVTAGGTQTISTTNSTANDVPECTLSVSNTNGNAALISSTVNWAIPKTTRSLVLNFDLQAAGTPTTAHWAVGLSSQQSIDPGNPANYALYFYGVDTNPNFQYGVNNNGVVTLTPTSTALSSSLTRFRIEIHGSSTTIGAGNNVVLFYINGTLVNTGGTPINLAAAFVPNSYYFTASLITTGANANAIRLGPVHCVYNMYSTTGIVI